jgi:type II secretory pathway pseudopilin PulG
MRALSNKARTGAGISLAELLVVIGVMGFVATAALGLIVATMTQGHVMENKMDTVDILRNTVDKVGRQVRMGRSLGDVYGNLVGTPPSQVVYGSLTFPGSNDPLYYNNAFCSYGGGLPVPVGGGSYSQFSAWPQWADGSTGTEPGNGIFKCSNTCLIVQTPIFDNSGPSGSHAGFPIAIPPDVGNGLVSFPKQEDDMETHIFRILQDPDQTNNPGEYIMQYAVFPALNTLNTSPPPSVQFGPATLCRHIVGPKKKGMANSNALDAVRVFQYIDETAPSAYNTLPAGTPEDIPSSNGNYPNGDMIANYSGVIMYLEVKSTQYSGVTANQKTTAVKAEMYLRNNAQATTMGGAT